MIGFLGWFFLAMGGAYALGGLAVFLVAGAGPRGLESIPAALFLGAVVALSWIALVIWWSPLSITFSQ